MIFLCLSWFTYTNLVLPKLDTHFTDTVYDLRFQSEQQQQQQYHVKKQPHLQRLLLSSARVLWGRKKLMNRENFIKQ